MARKLPKSFASTPEEDEFFEREKAASAAPPEEDPVEEEAAAPAEEPAVEEESTEEAVEETPDESTDEETPEADEKPSRTVPIGALHEEREKRRQLQAKIEQMEQTFSKMMERFSQQPQLAPAPAPAPEAPPIPAYEEDPVAHLKARIDQLTQLSTGTHQQIQQQSAMSKFVESLGTLENQMRATTPDYDEAIAFAKQSRYAELGALGYSPEASAEMMRQEILGTAAYCMQQGRNPVEAFYNYAKVRGWNGPNGQPPKPTVATTAKKLATVARAQSATKALPRGGSAPPATRTLEDLATMEDKDFDKYFDSIMRKT